MILTGFCELRSEIGQIEHIPHHKNFKRAIMWRVISWLQVYVCVCVILSCVLILCYNNKQVQEWMINCVKGLCLTIVRVWLFMCVCLCVWLYACVNESCVFFPALCVVSLVNSDVLLPFVGVVSIWAERIIYVIMKAFWESTSGLAGD